MGTCTHGVFGTVSTKQILHSAAKYPNAQAEQIDNKYSTKYNDSTNDKPNVGLLSIQHTK